jgi:hypothetical protein
VTFVCPFSKVTVDAVATGLQLVCVEYPWRVQDRLEFGEHSALLGRRKLADRHIGAAPANLKHVFHVGSFG